AKHALLGIDLKDFRLHVLVHVAAQAQVLEGFNLVAQPGGFLELESVRGLLHGSFHLANQLLLLAVQHKTQGPNLPPVVFLADAKVTRGRALVDAVQDARPEPAPALVVRVDVQGAGAEPEDPLQHLYGGAQALGTRERTVKPHAALPGRARELDAWKRLADADLQIRKRLIVLQLDVETRLNVLDQARLEQQGVDLAVSGEEVDVGYQLDQVAGPRILGGRLGEIVASPVAQVLGLADIQNAALGILHEIDPGLGRKLPGLFHQRQSVRISARRYIRHDTPASTSPLCDPAFRGRAPYSFIPERSSPVA